MARDSVRILNVDPDERPDFGRRLLGWLGIQIPGPGKKRFKLRRRFWLLLILFVVLGFGGGSFVYTSQPSFCSTCHNIRPYYESWTRSAHSDVNCLTCHTDPGTWNYLKRKMRAVSEVSVYMTKKVPPKPRAHISDASCLRDGCHTRQELSETTDFQVQRPEGVMMTMHFPHDVHLDPIDDKDLRCVSCHTQQTHQEHFSVAKESCFLCHLPRDKAMLAAEPTLPAVGTLEPPAEPEPDLAVRCQSCHDAPVGEIRLVTGTYDHAAYAQKDVDCLSCHQETIRGHGEVPQGMCLHCHSDPEYVAKFDQTELLHTAHVAGHQAKCFECHMPIEHGLAPQHVTAGTACGACHEDSHGPQQLLYAGQGGVDVPSMPSPMHRARVACAACHLTDEHGQLATGEEALSKINQQCVRCHDIQYEQKLADWKSQLEPMVAELEQVTARLERAVRVATLPAEDRRSAEEDLAMVQQNLALLREGQAVHNINYSLALLNTSLRRARSRLDQLNAGEGGS